MTVSAEIREKGGHSAGHMCLLTAVILAVFGVSCTYDFSWWDDWMNFLVNPRMNPPSWESLGYYLTHFADGLYVPVTYAVWLGIAALARLGQPDENGVQFNPWVFHAANLMVHLAAALLVYLVLCRLVRRSGAALAGAVFWAIHPLQVEAVCWPSGTKDLLAGCLGLAALLRYVVSVQRQQTVGRPARLDVIEAGLLGLALLSKPSALVIPLLGFVVDWLIVGRTFRSAVRTAGWWMLFVVPFAVIARVAQTIPAGNPIAPLWVRPFIFSDALTFYLGKLIVPIRLCIDYGRRWWVIDRHWWFYVEMIVPVGIAVVTWMGRKKFPWLAAGGLVFVMALLPVSGLTTFEFQFTSTTSDHYLYIAMLGPAMVFAFLMQESVKRVGAAVQWGAVIVILLALGLRAFGQARTWQNSLTLFSHALSVNPNSGVSHTNLGNVFWMRHDLPDAIREYRKAIEVDDEYWLAYANLKDRLLEMHDVDGAIAVMEKYVQVRKRVTGEDDPQVRGEIAELLRRKAEMDAGEKG